MRLVALLSAMSQLDVIAHFPLAPCTTLEVGGPARFYVTAPDRATLEAALVWAAQRQLPTFVLGGGSNLLVADAGFAGLVLRLSDGSAHIDPASGAVLAGAGMEWDELVRQTVEAGLQGIECLSGIPGRVGAAPIQNIGAYGQEMGETLVAVRAIERHSGQSTRLMAAQLGLGYRHSHFRGAWRDRYVITEVELQLRPGAVPEPRYPELQRALPVGASLAQAREAVLALRRAKSMVYDRSDANYRSAGSFFVNPRIDVATADALSARHPSMPRFAAGEHAVKLSAGWLIEQAGLPRGSVDISGHVGLSSRHALAIVNRGGATAAQVVAFAQQVQARVWDAFGVRLHAEPILLGFAPELTL